MKTKELREKNKEELLKIVSEKKEKIRKIRFDIAAKQVKDARALRNEKKDIARVLTLIREKS
jgi:ribosomal protein L29